MYISKTINISSDLTTDYQGSKEHNLDYEHRLDLDVTFHIDRDLALDYIEVDEVFDLNTQKAIELSAKDLQRVHDYLFKYFYENGSELTREAISAKHDEAADRFDDR